MKKSVSFLASNFQHIKGIFQFTPHEINTESGKSKERYRRILLTGGTTAIVKVFSAVINLFTVPLTLHYLGTEQYGLWMAISSFMVLMNFADLGLGIGLLNAISKANGKDDIRVAQIAVSSTFYMLFAISLLLLFIFLILYPYVNWPEVFNAQSDAAIRESGSTMFVLVMVFLVNMPLGVIQRIQDGYQEGFKFQIWQIVGSLISFFGLLLSIYLKAGLPWLVLAFSSGQLIATFLNGYILFYKQRVSLRPSIKYFDFITSKNLLQSGLIYFILIVLTLIGNSSDNIVLAHTLGATSVAGYEIVKKIFLFSMFTQFIIQPLWPAFGEALAKKEYNWASRTLKKAIKLSVLTSAIMSLPLLLFGKQIIILWVGPDLVPSWSLLLGFYIYILISNYGGVMSTFLNSGEMVKKQIIIIGLSSICSILLKIFLSIYFGVSGIIWATVIGYSIFYIIPTYKISFNYFKEKQNESLKINY
jgi:O-antigen/teichoic acid export membrane protein